MLKIHITTVRVCKETDPLGENEEIIRTFEVPEEIYEKMLHPEEYPNFSWSVVGERLDILDRTTYN